MSTTEAPTAPSTRQQARIDTEARIVAAARSLLVDQGEVTLRAVARELGLTAPALYRYAPNHQELVRMVAIAIDTEVGARVAAAADRQPADDPAARLIAACVEFRQWALAHRKEFALVFTNVDVECIKEHDESSGLVFAGLLLALWQERRFPVPALDDLDPALAEILRTPDAPVDPGTPAGLEGLTWLLIQGWSRLYGTVTLEVFGHVDARLVEEAHLFKAMIEDQAEPLGMVDDLPRLRPLLDSLLTGCGGGDGGDGPAPEPAGRATITVTSPAFAEGEAIPKQYTCAGEGISPPLEWTGVPADASVTVVVDDPDAPGGDYVHWVVEVMSGTVHGFEAGAPPATSIELRGSGGPGWTAPCPPSGTHRYRFTVYASPGDETFAVKGGSVTDFVSVLADRAVAWGRLTGTVTAP